MTERRNAGPRTSITATATEVPAGTRQGWPSMVRAISSGMVGVSEDGCPGLVGLDLR